MGHAYDGSTLTLVALRALGWVPLLNLGYFRLIELPMLAFGLGHFQRRLARRAIRLLDPLPGERILDVGCGYGWTTREIASHGAQVLGLDLVERQVEIARGRFGHLPGVSYRVGDAADLEAAVKGWAPTGGRLDGILCLESAFQFGVAGRRAFLSRAFELLRPGGRLILVDFTWATGRPERIAELDLQGYVRETWQFDEFEPIERYGSEARRLGFIERTTLDWSRPVIDRFLRLCTLLPWLAGHRLTRRLLCRIRPGLAGLDPEDWATVSRILEAHDRVRACTRYVAMVFEKPGAEGAASRPGDDLSGPRAARRP